MLQKLGIIALAILVTSTTFGAEQKKKDSLSAFSIVPPIQYPDQGKAALTRFSVIYGQHAGIIGLDVGLIGNMTDQFFLGTAISGLFNINNGKTYIIGAQIAGLTNWIKSDAVVAGVQLTAGVNYIKGSGHIGGLQLGLLGNVATNTNIYGFQVGIYNEAADVYGFQFGLVNIARKLHGIQIGLVNIQHEGLIRFLPLINAGF